MAPFLSWLSLLQAFFPLLLLLFLWRNRRRAAPITRLPPGPSKLPLLGNLHQLGPLLHTSLWRLSKAHGPLMRLQLGSVPALVISSPRVAREALRVRDHACSGRPSSVSIKRLSYNSLDLAFAPYSDYWRQMRKLCNLHLFSSARVDSLAFSREEEVAQMIQSIALSSSACSAVNLSELLVSLSKNVTCRAAFGDSSIQGRGLYGSRERFYEILEESQQLLAAFFFADYLPLGNWVDFISGKLARLEKTFLELDRFYEEVIEEHLQHPTDHSRSEEEDDLVHVMLRFQVRFGLTKDHIKGILMNILVAGTDTSSATVVWAMTELMRNKKVMGKVQEEVRRTVKEKGKVRESDLTELRYLKLVLKETFRLHPPTPLLVPHETIEGCTIDGYKIPAKTRVYVNTYAIGRDPETWEDPDEFLPERFLNSPIDYKGNDFELLPFGAGRRMCPAITMGMTITELALANLLYHFTWEVPRDQTGETVLDLSEKQGITVHKKFPLLLMPTIHDFT